MEEQKVILFGFVVDMLANCSQVKKIIILLANKNAYFTETHYGT
jgi:hypothetical protein